MTSQKIGPTGHFDSSPALNCSTGQLSRDIRLGSMRRCIFWDSSVCDEVRTGSVAGPRDQAPPPLAQRYLWGTATIPVGTRTNRAVLCKLGSSLQVHCSATKWNLETFNLEGTSSLNIWMKKLRPREQAGG